MRQGVLIVAALLALVPSVAAQDISGIFPWLTEVKVTDYQSFYVDASRSTIQAQQIEDGVSIGKVFVGNNIPMAEVTVIRGMYDDSSVRFIFVLGGKQITASLPGVLRKIIVPGTGVVYTIESSRLASSSSQLRKFVWQKDSFKEVEQAFNYYGSDRVGDMEHVARRNLTIYTDSDLRSEVGTISEGSKVYVIGWKMRVDLAKDNSTTRSMLVLARTQLGLVGWCQLENFYLLSSDISGLGSTQ